MADDETKGHDKDKSSSVLGLDTNLIISVFSLKILLKDVYFIDTKVFRGKVEKKTCVSMKYTSLEGIFCREDANYQVDLILVKVNLRAM